MSAEKDIKTSVKEMYVFNELKSHSQNVYVPHMGKILRLKSKPGGL